MKITTIKTSRSNRQTRKLVALAELVEEMKHDTRNEDISIMRNTLLRNWQQGENDVSPTKQLFFVQIFIIGLVDS
jgi:hypothetical protein